jgi:hypothetical protein
MGKTAKKKTILKLNSCVYYAMHYKWFKILHYSTKVDVKIILKPTFTI